jgi:hypothetical protein
VGFVALTDRFVSHAKAQGVPQLDYFDEGVPGLALRVSSTGRKTWTFHYTSPGDGKRARLTIGTYPATTLANARGLATEARGAVEAGTDPRTRTTGAMTIATLVQSYVEKHVASLRTAVEIERRIRRNIVPVIGEVRLADFHRRDVNRCVDPIIKRGSPIEAARAFEDLRAMLRWAVSRGDLDHNPIGDDRLRPIRHLPQLDAPGPRPICRRDADPRERLSNHRRRHLHPHARRFPSHRQRRRRCHDHSS